MDIKLVDTLRLRLDTVGRPMVLSEEVISHQISDFGKCLRERYYRMIGAPADEQFTPSTLDIFEIGKAIEQWFLDKCAYAGLLRGRNVRIRNRELNVSGEVDGILQIDDNDTVCLEIKTANHWSYQHKINEISSGSIENGHYFQVQGYLTFSDVFDYALYVLINKNTTEYAVVRVEHDANARSVIVDNIMQLNRAVENRQPPTRYHRAQFNDKGEISEASDWQCRYCRWRLTCWEVPKK